MITPYGFAIILQSWYFDRVIYNWIMIIIEHRFDLWNFENVLTRKKSLWNNCSNCMKGRNTCSYSSLYSWYLIFSSWQKIGKEIKLWAFNFYVLFIHYQKYLNCHLLSIVSYDQNNRFKKSLQSRYKVKLFLNRAADIDKTFFCSSTFVGNQNRRYFHHHHQPHQEQILHFGSENQERDVQKDDGLFVSVWLWYLLF